MLCQDDEVRLAFCQTADDHCAYGCLSATHQSHHVHWKVSVQKEKMWLQGNPNIQQLSSRIPESNGPSVSGFQMHIAYVLQHRDVFLGYYGTKRLRQQKWGVYKCKQKAMEYMCRKVTGGRDKANVTVVFGSAHGPPKKAPSQPLSSDCTKLFKAAL